MTSISLPTTAAAARAGSNSSNSSPTSSDYGSPAAKAKAAINQRLKGQIDKHLAEQEAKYAESVVEAKKRAEEEDRTGGGGCGCGKKRNSANRFGGDGPEDGEKEEEGEDSDEEEPKDDQLPYHTAEMAAAIRARNEAILGDLSFIYDNAAHCLLPSIEEPTPVLELERIRKTLLPLVQGKQGYMNALALGLTDKYFMEALIWSEDFDDIILEILAELGMDYFPRPSAPGARFVMMLRIIRQYAVRLITTGFREAKGGKKNKTERKLPLVTEKVPSATALEVKELFNIGLRGGIAASELSWPIKEMIHADLTVQRILELSDGANWKPEGSGPGQWFRLLCFRYSKKEGIRVLGLTLDAVCSVFVNWTFLSYNDYTRAIKDLKSSPADVSDAAATADRHFKDDSIAYLLHFENLRVKMKSRDVVA
ncbi:hypothetical protein BJ508DRAFT_324848 [Ascobolus immersus RN42]|uniref:Uncharacterized protein n=1 Tax=Ascobolus immersus RN42 TaxID=1160509 RepID=A0A3N4ICQ6_ASCIM|nr:hypothetical protein BJ508DRAFT_324848 [Ascobolus immersus RN42]